jgi:hypothetical protein
MTQFFPHEKLQVYAHALSFARMAAALIDSWPSVMAVCGQLDRATESIVTNLAKAARLRATENGIYCLKPDHQHRGRQRPFLEAGSQQLRFDCGGRGDETCCLPGFGGGRVGYANGCCQGALA